jgi:hypothetical protein
VPAIATPGAYAATVAGAVLGCGVLTALARVHPGPWRVVAGRILGLVLVADAVSFVARLVIQGTFSPKTSLPLALCDMAALVAAAWW